MDESDFSDMTVCIVGLGLMGGSMALALRDKVGTLLGVDRNKAVCGKASKAGFVSEATADLETGVGLADAVILATPVRTIVDILGQIGPWLTEGTTVLDLGSVKRPVVAMMDALPPTVRAIGGHPMCGKEQAGLDAAEAELFQRRTFVLCETARTDDQTLRLAETLCDAIGARPYMIDAERHDRVAAGVSHAPAMLSMALVSGILPHGSADPATGHLASSGFRDVSRLAASDPTMMTDVLLSNTDAVGESLAAIREELDTLMRMTEAGDREALQAHLTAIRKTRNDWAEEHGFAA